MTQVLELQRQHLLELIELPLRDEVLHRRGDEALGDFQRGLDSTLVAVRVLSLETAPAISAAKRLIAATARRSCAGRAGHTKAFAARRVSLHDQMRPQRLRRLAKCKRWRFRSHSSLPFRFQ